MSAPWPDVAEPGTVPVDLLAERQTAERFGVDVGGWRFVDGGSFVLDAPDQVVAVWGNGQEVLWADGEALTVVGPPGVGKSTIAGQLVRALMGLAPDVLGYNVQPAAGRVLYLAMDRPSQIARALRRHFAPEERAALEERLVVWKGPPPADLARHTDLLAGLCDRAGASHVVIDSLKDAAIGLTEDEVGAGYNRARQTALAAGVQVLELHHVVKRGANGARPTTLADLYGSAWLSAGTGSVLLLWGAAGDPIVELHHLKQPAEPVGPLRVIHDHAAGHSSVWHATDALSLLAVAGASGRTVKDVAAAMFETDQPDRNHLEKARRKLERLVEAGHVERIEGPAEERGGPARPRYRALTEALTRLPDGGALTIPGGTHAQRNAAGQALTQALTPLTQQSTHVPTPLFRGGGTGAGQPKSLTDLLDAAPTTPSCAACGLDLDPRAYPGDTTHASCKELS